MKTTKILPTLIALLLLPLSVANASIIPIDLRDFDADPTVTVAADGSSATMAEDASLITVLLTNDPYYGYPGISVPSGLLSLNFSYSFAEGIDNEDNFYAKVFDGATGTILSEFLIEDSGLGIVSWDLSTLDPAIVLLGLEFQLNSYDTAFNSVASVSNVSLEISDAVPVPLPGTVLLLGSGVFTLLGFRKRFFV